jgi:hypothetical protein
MRTLSLVLLTMVVCFGGADAQDPSVTQRRLLQRQVLERLLQNGRVQAGLDDQQFERYQEIARRSIAGRNEIQRQERELWRALEGQMRPGVAADEDSVTTLIDMVMAIPEQRLELARLEQEQYSQFLTPVQRAQLVLLHRRFETNIQQIMQRRRPSRPGQGS